MIPVEEDLQIQSQVVASLGNRVYVRKNMSSCLPYVVSSPLAHDYHQMKIQPRSRTTCLLAVCARPPPSSINASGASPSFAVCPVKLRCPMFLEKARMQKLVRPRGCGVGGIGRYEPK